MVPEDLLLYRSSLSIHVSAVELLVVWQHLLVLWRESHRLLLGHHLLGRPMIACDSEVLVPVRLGRHLLRDMLLRHSGRWLDVDGHHGPLLTDRYLLSLLLLLILVLLLLQSRAHRGLKDLRMLRRAAIL